MEWKVVDDDSRFSEVLDRAEHEGPQLVRRRDKRFLVLLQSEEQEEENRFVRAFLDEPEFRNINVDRINAPMKDPEL